MRRLFQWKVSFAQASYATTGFRGTNSGLDQTKVPAGNKQKIRGKTVLVAGATGGVGTQVVQCLCNEGAKVRALVRDYTKVVWPLDLLAPVLGTPACLFCHSLLCPFSKSCSKYGML